MMDLVQEMIKKGLKTQKDILSALYFLNQATIYELMVETEKPRITIHDNLVKLVKNKIIEKSSIHTGKPGRPMKKYTLVECAD